jgi:hypothetical protein
MTNSFSTVQRVWNYCNVLRDDGSQVAINPSNYLGEASAASAWFEQILAPRMLRPYHWRLVNR